MLDSGKAMDRVVFQEIHSGEIFGFDSFLTGAPAYSSIVVDSEKAVVSAVQRASRLPAPRSKQAPKLFLGRCCPAPKFVLPGVAFVVLHA